MAPDAPWVGTVGHDGVVPPPDKTCIACGRRFQWRKKWERDWDEVRYCSAACRSRGVSSVDRALEQHILDLLAQRDAGKTICVSEAARAQGRTETEWRALMEPARRAARRLVEAGEVEITQGGRVVDPSTARGPIRVRRRAQR